MPHRQAIELLPVVLPLGQKPIHGRHKALAVAGFNQVGQLVHDHVLQVLGRLLGQVGVQANQSSFWVAAAPLGFHALHQQLARLHTHDGLPFAQQRLRGLTHLGAVPRIQQCLAFVCGCTWAQVESPRVL